MERSIGSMGSEYRSFHIDPEALPLFRDFDWNSLAKQVFIDPVTGLIALMMPSPQHEGYARRAGAAAGLGPAPLLHARFRARSPGTGGGRPYPRPRLPDWPSGGGRRAGSRWRRLKAAIRSRWIGRSNNAMKGILRIFASAAFFLLAVMNDLSATEQMHKEIATAMAEFTSTKHLAEHGRASAQFNLALLYYNGYYSKGKIRHNYAEALKWYRRAAEQGHIGAQYNLALMYSNGEGVEQNYIEAITWYRRAANQGDAAAQFNLCLQFYNGIGVPQDYAEAAKLYRRAAEQGDPGA